MGVAFPALSGLTLTGDTPQLWGLLSVPQSQPCWNTGSLSLHSGNPRVWVPVYLRQEGERVCQGAVDK